MFDIRHQEQKINELKVRLGLERQAVAAQLQVLVPQARRAAALGSLSWGMRKALPLLKPLVVGLVGRGVSKTMPGRLMKLAGLAITAFGAWRLSRTS